MVGSIITIGLFLGFAGVVFAQFVPPNLTFPNPLAPCGDIPCVVKKIIDVLFVLAVPLVGVLVIIGGYQILFSAGNAEKVSLGKKTILYSTIGFVIILCAKGVVLLIQDFFN